MEVITTLAKEIQNAAVTADEAGCKESLDSLRDIRELSLSIDVSHAKYVAIPVEDLATKSKSLSWAQAAVVGVPYSTVYLMLEKAAARAGDVAPRELSKKPQQKSEGQRTQYHNYIEDKWR
ncbi:hypothetical protein SBOR_7211 [Sclerotinia borealis F-4128]|uniref:Uncharacterized protein n=1 Tax=Sclerotinia borealis (strain F-4128) TaxID=1432307 RepID=W9C9D5_SCLBF|nr:hypothetical protein SBOR_7211 [Sclerotinia borealis F-4128]